MIDGAARPAGDLFAIGVVAQNTRWFTQVGTGRPGQDSPLCRDADAIALALLGRNAAAAAPGLRSQAAPDRRRTGSPVID